MQDLVRIRKADPADGARIRERSLQSMIRRCQSSPKACKISREDVNAARVDASERLFALEKVQCGSMLCPGFCQHERAFRKIEGGEILTSRELRIRIPPMQPSRDHE